MSIAAHVDFETRSTVDLKRCGMYRYAEDPSTGILCMSYRIGDGPIEEWDPSMECPLDLLLHVEAGRRFVAHNAGFERNIWNKVARRDRPWWPPLRIEQQDCTMARAAAVHLPQDLDKLSVVLRLTNRKDDEGANLMRKVCKPRSIAADGTITWWDFDMDRLKQYCSADVLAEEEADRRLPELSLNERATWEFDQLVNDRGFALDLPLIDKLLTMADIAQAAANRRMWEITGGAVKKCSQTKEIVKWLNARGITTTSIGKGEADRLVILTQMLGDELAEQAVLLRNETVKASTAKLKSALKSACADWRAHGMLRFCGASATRRWSGSLYQPHNLPRVDADRDLPDVLELFEMLITRAPREAHDLFVALTGPAMPAISKSLRGTIVAKPGHKLIGADFANVEGRFNSWLGGDEWKLRAFEAYDRGEGPDLYRVSYAESFSVSVDEVTGPLRQIGKVQELALGYQGGVGAFLSMAANYNVKPDMIRAALIDGVRDTPAWEKASLQYENAPARFGLSRDQWLCLRIVVNKWRDRNAGITQSWWDLQDAAVQAVEHPQTIVSCLNDRVRYLCNMGVLWCQLPTGGVLAYQAPRLVERRQARFVDDDGELVEGMSDAELELAVLLGDVNVEMERVKVTVAFEGTNQKTRQWGTQYLYGGLQSNNVVQGSCRDFLAMGLKRCEAAGYPIVLHVHDEGVAEVLEAFGSPAEFGALLAAKPPGFESFPLVAKAWEDRRYVK